MFSRERAFASFWRSASLETPPFAKLRRSAGRDSERIAQREAIVSVAMGSEARCESERSESKDESAADDADGIDQKSDADVRQQL